MESLLAIAHGGYLGHGRMSPLTGPFTNGPVDCEYVENRAHWERRYEATQTEGDAKAHRFLSPNDEFARCEE